MCGGRVVCLRAVWERGKFTALSPTHMRCGFLCICSLLQGTIKLTFADQHSQQTDHLDAYKPKPEIKVCIQFRAVKCGVVCGVVWCGVLCCGDVHMELCGDVVWCMVWFGVVLCVMHGVVRCGEVWCSAVW